MPPMGQEQEKKIALLCINCYNSSKLALFISLTKYRGTLNVKKYD